ncbi:uncharacterized protein PGTG_22140 [Puccinia graminis f. sp. tritici CRL 75-36-700-3]|uniref:Uncharacterized protein n=1 Tax=Puccinia graminis f. sp. tritici (strain CRL 75-36-700-3 / race SCCL) TaxID=418459 RepID=H6QTP4_PUCGT|nr:uncharacterized protein PGTG_22140 [Puccinia graminis f. sp. tritici CRL 75-36-700-3]EHS64259.1 hypothetical protein PGTG_22140 [Puccinia graminis f. sp. tritici CRL 75-36-700-3]
MRVKVSHPSGLAETHRRRLNGVSTRRRRAQYDEFLMLHPDASVVSENQENLSPPSPSYIGIQFDPSGIHSFLIQHKNLQDLRLITTNKRTNLESFLSSWLCQADCAWTLLP